MLTAYVRPPGTRLPECALTHLEREPIDVALARVQHAAYREGLRSLGARVVELPVLDERPDSCFVEDTALVLDELVVVTRPALESRRGETVSTAEALGGDSELLRIAAPATIEGGDILRVGRTLYVGNSERSNRAGHEALAECVAPFGYRVHGVNTTGCLHLKSAVTGVGPRTLLVNSSWVDIAPFSELELVEVDPGEPSAANVLRIGDSLLMPAGFPRTARRLMALGKRVEVVDLSEFQKAEGAATCLSLLQGMSEERAT